MPYFRKMMYGPLEREPIIYEGGVIHLEMDIGLMTTGINRPNLYLKIIRNWKDNGLYMSEGAYDILDIPREWFNQEVLTGMKATKFNEEKLSVRYYLCIEGTYLESIWEADIIKAEKLFLKWTKEPSAREIAQERGWFAGGYYFCNDAFVYADESNGFWVLSRTELQNAIQDEFAKLRKFLNALPQENKIILTAPPVLLNELERRQLFYLLKKQTSWTAWNRIMGFYKKWKMETEEVVRQGEQRSVIRGYDRIAQAYALMDEGVRSLGRGDKRVFTCDSEPGYFCQAQLTMIRWVRENYRRRKILFPKAFSDAISDLNFAWCECADILEIERDWYALIGCTPVEIDYLSRQPYPDPLPELPEVPDEVTINTGEVIPYSGIWEPMVDGRPCGAMNYLHGGRKAPMHGLIRVETKFINIAWHLLWRDNRYEDCIIPEEEKGYIFLYPEPKDGLAYSNSPSCSMLQRFVCSKDS